MTYALSRIDHRGPSARRLKETRQRFVRALRSTLEANPDAAALGEHQEALQATLILNAWMEIVREVSLSVGPIHTRTLETVTDMFIDAVNRDVEIRPEKPS